MEGRQEAPIETAVLFNPRMRSIRWQGIAGARIRPGTISSRDRSGMGDCILMDLRKGFFAVSDSPNRFPTASRRFLRKLARGLEALPSPEPVSTLSLETFDRFSRAVVETSEGVLQTIPYTESCTFTGILVARTEAGMKGILLHTGDSRLYEVRRKNGASRSMTQSNFLMVGKSKRFSQVEKIEIPADTTFILATDGVVDLSSENRVGRHESLVDVARRYPVEEIPDRLVEAIDRQQAATDDLVIVSLAPDRLRPSEATILLGGTEEREESRYRTKCSQEVYEDRYVPIREQSSKRECALSVE
jgi:hypothetical protein